MNDEPKKIPDLAYRDPLTGLHNRVYFESKLKEEVRRVKRDRGIFSLAILDLDYFKLCNDTLGNRWGDQILKRVGELLQAKLKADDCLSRFEGDEFTILFPGQDLKKSEASVKELQRALAKGHFPGQELFDELFPRGKLTASIGLTAFHPQMQNEFDLIAWADYALYRAKRQGRDRLVIQEGPPHAGEQAKKPLTLFEGLSAIFPMPIEFSKKLQRAVELIQSWMEVDVCSLYFLEERSLVLRATEGLEKSTIGQVKMKTSEGLTGLVIETMTMVCARDAQHHPRYKYFPDTGESQYGSYLGVPVLYEHDPLGVLVVQTRAIRDFSEEEIKIVQAIAGFLGSFLKTRSEA